MIILWPSVGFQTASYDRESSEIELKPGEAPEDIAFWSNPHFAFFAIPPRNLDFRARPIEGLVLRCGVCGQLLDAAPAIVIFRLIRQRSIKDSSEAHASLLQLLFYDRLVVG
jgi:hypothetical protein